MTRMDIELLPAPPRCELCGAERTEAGTERPRPNESIHTMLHYLAELSADDHLAVRCLFARMLAPRASYRALAASVGVSHVRVQQKIRRLQEINPMMADFLRDHSAYSLAAGRRKAVGPPGESEPNAG